MLRIKMMDEARNVVPEPAIDEPDEAIDDDGDDQENDDVQMSSAEGRVDPAMARYHGPEAMCQGCLHFLEPDACEIVAGTIDPEGICSLFTADEEDVATKLPQKDA